MIQRLFVYGTLAPGQPNEHILAKLKGNWYRASVKGHKFHLGWGADYGYPGLKLDEQGPVVNGMVFESKELKEYWSYLDKFEGDEYVRVITEVDTENGSKEAYLYVVKEKE